MIVSTLDAQNHLGVSPDRDAIKINSLLRSAHDYALQYMNRKSFTEFKDNVPQDVKVAVLVLVQAAYKAEGKDIEELYRVAEFKLSPFRRGMGV